MSRDKIIKDFLRNSGKKGGASKTSAQTEARRKNMAKARKNRWKKKQ